MKKIFGLTIAALMVMGLIGGGTWAYFSDPETSSGNAITAGILDLTLNGGSVDVTLLSGVTGKAPGDSGNVSGTLANAAGGITGELSVNMSAITNTAGATGEFAGGADLGGVAELALFIDVNGNDVFNAGTDIALYSDGSTNTTALQYATIDSYSTDQWGFTSSGITTIAGGSYVKFFILWQIPTGAGNSIQGDSSSFAVTFTLEQTGAD